MTDDKKPNIVLITMDTARAKSFSCYGYEKKTSPFLDKMAEKHVKYEHAVTQAPWTLPSHASIFTGKYITNHGQYSKDKSFDDIDSFTEDLAEEGYTTIGLTNIAYLSPEFGFDQLFDEFEFVGGKTLFEDSEIIQRALEGEKEDRWEGTRQKYKELFIEAIKDRRFKDLFEGVNYVFGKYVFRGDDGAKKTNEIARKKLEGQEEPFFMFLNYIEPHAPYRPPFPYSHKFLENKLRWRKLLNISGETVHKYAAEEVDPDSEVLNVQESLYNGEINYLDQKIKQLYESIKSEHPNTVFIITSDHGEYFYEHGMINHFGDVHEPVAHVPLIEIFPDGRSENVEESVELRALEEHIIDLSQGEFKTLETSNPVIEYYGAQSSLWDFDEAFTEEDKERLNRYKAGSYINREKAIFYSDGTEKFFQLPEDEQKEGSSAREKLKQNVVEKVGEPEEKTYEDKEQEVEEEIKDKLGDLGYM